MTQARSVKSKLQSPRSKRQQAGHHARGRSELNEEEALTTFGVRVGRVQPQPLPIAFYGLSFFTSTFEFRPL